MYAHVKYGSNRINNKENMTNVKVFLENLNIDLDLKGQGHRVKIIMSTESPCHKEAKYQI